jgi:hypothetical protein
LIMDYLEEYEYLSDYKITIFPLVWSFPYEAYRGYD